MIKSTNIFLLITILFVSASIVSLSQVTTSFLKGKVVDTDGNALIGATVKAVHEPTGTIYGTMTKVDGLYRINNIRVGGPYTITVTYTGYASFSYENVTMRLGELEVYDFELPEESVSTDVVTVTASASTVGENAGTSTQITQTDINNLPTLDRGLEDFLRLTPQASTIGSGTSIGGVNNRFNAIFIDGAVNNDVFGLASSGTNGGQTGIEPFSLDIIDQIQVVISPYDVTLSGFAGGGINAVTRSGSNEFKGTFYQFYKNQGLVGSDNQDFADGFNDGDRESVDDFVERQIGGSISGPIIKDKLFFFTNVEIQRDETPVPFNVNEYLTSAEEGRYSVEQLNQLRQHVINNYGYDPGTFGNVTDNLDGTKFFGKLNWNINDNHKLVLRHQYTKAEQFNRNAGNLSRINFSNNGIYFPSTTNSSALELNSIFGSKYSNNLIIGYTRVRDDRGPLSSPFPYVRIDDQAGGRVEFGSEQFSTANQLDQDIFSLTNNFNIFAGNHSITIGTHNEFYNIYNLFLRQEFGFYRYDNIDAFINDEAPILYQRTYAREGAGDGAADFNAAHFGLYAQDEWTVSDNLTLTFGLRFDLPMILDDPRIDPSFNSETMPSLEDNYLVAEGVQGGQSPDPQLMISPRFGFTYLLDEFNTRIRGGAGIFTSRIPFVWPGAMFTNNGVNAGGVDLRGEEIEQLKEVTGDDGYFSPDADNQFSAPATEPSGQVDLFSSDFRYPQVFRTSLGFDFMLPWGIETTIEGFYTKTLNNIVYTNVNSDPTVQFSLSGSPDNKVVYTGEDIDPTYDAIYLASNTNEGYTYNIAATFAKRFDFGLDVTASYSWSDAQAINEGTSSQNSSQWRGQVSIDGRNNPVLGRSDFAVGHRIVAAVSYTKNWTKSKLFGTTVSLLVNAQSGQPFSYVLGGGFGAQNINNETGSVTRNRSLIYIPERASDINLIDYTSGENVVTAEEQWERLEAFIEDDPYLSENRGQFAEKNGRFAPFRTTFDLSIRQDLGIAFGGTRNRLQLSFDIFNLGNLLNSSWGTVYQVPNFGYFNLYQFEGFEEDGTTGQYTFRLPETGNEAFAIDRFLSRWRAQVGIRYLFN